jgi:REP element-mobilizing transposase RayT
VTVFVGDGLPIQHGADAGRVGVAHPLRHGVGFQTAIAQRRRREQVEESAQQAPATESRLGGQYHVVVVPKYRRRSIYGALRRQIGGIPRELCRHAGIELVEGHAMADQIHLCLSIPPKFSVANTVGFLKAKSAIRVHREYLVVSGVRVPSRIVPAPTRTSSWHSEHATRPRLARHGPPFFPHVEQTKPLGQRNRAIYRTHAFSSTPLPQT